MRILHITKKYPPLLGGDASVVKNLEAEQKKAGHEVFILTSKTDRTSNAPGVIQFGSAEHAHKLDRITIRRIFSLILLFFASFSLFRRIKPAIIHTHSPDLGFVCSCAAHLYGIPLVHTCHGVTFTDSQYSRIKRVLEQFFLQRARFAKIITVDATTLPVLRQAHFAPVISIPNGVDTDFFTPALEKHPSREFTFLFVGRLERQKGVAYLIEAVKALLTTSHAFKVLIIGEGSQGRSLREQVSKDRLESAVFFLGQKENWQLREYYQQADALVLPSLWEGFPLTILEAWASGIAVIASRVNGIPTMCIDQKNAWLIPKGDVKELSRVMETLLEKPELAALSGQAGRELVTEQYSWSSVSEQTLKVYEHLLHPGS